MPDFPPPPSFRPPGRPPGAVAPVRLALPRRRGLEGQSALPAGEGGAAEPSPSTAGVDPFAEPPVRRGTTPELEKALRALELRLTERDRTIFELENKLAERDREYAEVEALLAAREKVVAALRAGPAETVVSKEEQEALQALRAELERQEAALKEAKASLKEREAFLEESENRLFDKVQAQQEKETELEQLEEELQEREQRLRDREATHDPVAAAALASPKARVFDEFNE